MKTTILLLAAMLIVGRQSGWSRSYPPGQMDGKSITIRIEQKKAEQIVEMRPDHVFDAGDIVRFRLTSGFDGYLYVINLGSSGVYTPLFPASGTTGNNRIYKGADALVPSTEDGWFEVSGPTGFDVLYIVVSLTAIEISADQGHKSSGEGNGGPSVTGGAASNQLKPRCNDAIFQARGECIDESAGPSPLARDAPLPPQIMVAVPKASRDIVLVEADDEKSVAVSAPSATPVVYIFRLAHR